MTNNATVTFNSSFSSSDVAVSTRISVFAIVMVSFQIVLLILIIAGNVLVLVAIHKIRALRDITGIFVGNLALADLIIGITLPFQVLFFFYPDLAKNKYACMSRFLIVSFSCNASIFSLTCTVVDRYVAIVYPLRYPDIMTKTSAFVMVAAIWILDIALTIVPFLGVNQWGSSPFCIYPLVISWEYRLSLNFVDFTCAIFMMVLYTHILIIAHQKSRQVMPNEQGNRFSKNPKNVVVLIVVVVFHASWLPYFCAQMMMITPEDVTPTKVMISSSLTFLGIANSLVNPVIYVWKNQHYRNAFKTHVLRQDVTSSTYNLP